MKFPQRLPLRIRKAMAFALRASAPAALSIVCMTPARADIVTLENGKVLKGLVRDLPDSPDQIEFTGASSKLTLLRARIAGIQAEPPAMGWIHIGSEHRRLGHLGDALAAFKQALDLDPENAEARALLDETQAAIAERDRMSREEALKRIDDLAGQAREQVGKADFEQAEKFYQQANDLIPSAEQAKGLADEISRMYKAWGDDRLDKLDPLGAEAKFNLAVEANRENFEAVNQLLKLWEGKAEKREQAASIYETILERNPEDNDLRRKLGELYDQLGRTEDMVHHYLELYKQSEQWKGTVVERKLIEGLDKLHRQYARAKDYDKAIRTYNLLASLDPATDSTAVVYYEYLKRANALGAEDFKGRLALARFAEQNGMDAEALEKYKSLVNYESTHDEALAGMTRYAAKQLSMAQLHFNSRNYTLAQTLADQVRKDFSYIDAVAEKAAEIIGRAEAEIAREQRQQTERAQGVLRSADEFYAQADRHFQNLFSTERRNNPYLMSDRQEALRYYQLAIGAYEEARRLNPALGQDPNSLINVRLQEAYRRIASLTQVPTGGVGRHSFQYRYNEQSGN